ncbi:MAG: hypothetical protein ACR2M0_12300 [Chloroflexia bacterium]
MSTTLAPPPAAQATPTASEPPATRSAVPGRDMALFLLLLFATDFSGLLHIYGLSWLYGEPLFLGLGWTMVLVAAFLLLLPSASRLRSADCGVRTAVWAALALVAVVVLTALAGTFLFQALTETPVGCARDPHQDTVLGGLPALQLGVLGAIPATAFAVAYTRYERVRRGCVGLIAVVLFSLSVVNLLYDAHVGKHASDTWAILAGGGPVVGIGVGLLILAACGLAYLSPARFLAATVGAGLALRALGLVLIPLSIRLGDMLPLVGKADDRLQVLQNPYIVYKMPWDLPLTYWPLTVLSYLPASLAGLDLRLVNLLVGPLVGLLLLVAGGRRGPGPAAYAFGLLYLAPTMLQWDISTAAPPFWLWLCAAFAALVVAGRRGGWFLPGAAGGAALAAAPLALPFLPFLGVLWLGEGWRTALRRALWAGTALGVLVGPFVLWDAVGFWNGAVAWFNDTSNLPLLKWQTDRSWAFEIGLAGPIWSAGQEAWLKPLQIALVGGLFVASLLVRPRPIRAPGDALRWGAAAYLLFMVVNPVIWPYLYVPALLALVFALLPAAGSPGRLTSGVQPVESGTEFD